MTLLVLTPEEEQALEDIQTGKTKMVNCSLEEILKDIIDDRDKENKK